MSQPKTKLLQSVRANMRLRHYSQRTESTYVDWIRRFIRYHGTVHPIGLGAPHVREFLRHLAVERKVAVSTQSQARATGRSSRCNELFNPSSGRSHMIRATIFGVATTVIAAACLSGIADAQAVTDNPHGGPVKNVVLVHGAFADGSGWRGVYEELTGRGYRVTIVQNPLTSLADDVAATNRALARQDGPTVLVGHSWGGTVITDAGIHPNVAALVYVSALSPDAGESSAEQYSGFTTPPEFVIETSPDGYGIVKPEMFRAGFAADASTADVEFLRDAQVPINMSVFSTRVANAAWRTKPTWAIIATDDKAFDQRMLHAMAKRMGASIREVKASHAVFMTQPKAVAEVIHEAAQGAARAAH